MDTTTAKPQQNDIEAALKAKRKEVRDRFEFAMGISEDQMELLNDMSIILDRFISSCIPF